MKHTSGLAIQNVGSHRLLVSLAVKVKAADGSLDCALIMVVTNHHRVSFSFDLSCFS